MASQRLGTYLIRAQIAEGGMSVVYQAYDTRRRCDVALKLLKAHLAQDETSLKRFRAEGQNAAAMNHPNLVRIYESSEIEGHHYIALEYLDGGSVADRLEQLGGSLQPSDVVGIVSQVASGLDYMHDLGFLHCDIKPSNILLTHDSRAVLSDFGIAQNLASSTPGSTLQFLGTPAYMSPERARGDRNIDRRSDVYGLGVVSYVMLTGSVPFSAESQEALLRKVIVEPPPDLTSVNPSLSPRVAHVLQRALAKDPNVRYSSAGEFASCLKQSLEETPSARTFSQPTVPFVPTRLGPSAPPRPVPPNPLLQHANEPHGWPVLITALSIAALIVGLFIGLSLFRKSDRSPEPYASDIALTPAVETFRGAIEAGESPTPSARPSPSPTLLVLPPSPQFVAFRTPSATAILTASTNFSWVPLAGHQDGFDTGQSGWPTVQNAESHWRTEGGAYRLTVGSPHVMSWVWRGLMVADYTISAGAKTLSARPDEHFGLILRATGADNYYQLDYWPNQGYEVTKVVSGLATVLAPRSMMVSKKADDSVLLGIVAVGPQLQVLIDGNPAVTISDAAHTRGDVAFYGVSGASSGAEFAFDDFVFEPNATEAVTIELVPYVDPSKRFALYVPTGWYQSSDEWGVNFDSPDRLARVFVHQVPGVQPGDSATEVGRRYLDLARATFQNIAEGPEEPKRLDTLDGVARTLRATVLGVGVDVRMLAVNDRGRGYVVVAAVASLREAAMRPPLDYILDSFRAGEAPILPQIAAPSERVQAPTVTPARTSTRIHMTPSPTASSSPTSPALAPRPSVQILATTTASKPDDATLVLDFEHEASWSIGDQHYGTARSAPDQWTSGRQSLRIDYAGLPGRDKPNQHFIVLRRPASAPIPDKPAALTAQVYGDGGDCYLNLWIADAESEVWQFSFGQVEHTGWQTMTLTLDPVGAWPVGIVQSRGNAILDFPLQLQALVLDNSKNQIITGTIYMDDLRIVVPSASTATSRTDPVSPLATTQPQPPETSSLLSGHIVYSIWEAGGGIYRLVMRRADGTDPQYIYDGATQPDFCLTPPNRIIANGFRPPREGTVAIDIGGSVREVIPSTRDSLPACSPEGQRVVLQSDREGALAIWMHRDINVRDDKASQKLGAAYLGSYPTWSSRWQIIWRGCNLWSSNGGECGLWQVPDSGRGNPVRVSSGGSDTAPDVAPDGSMVAYMSKETGRWQVFLASANGGGNTQLTSQGDNGLPSWSPDGRNLAFVSNRDGGWGLWMMSTNGKSQRKLVDLEPGFGLGPIDWTEQRISWGR